MNKKISTGPAFLIIVILSIFSAGIIRYLSNGISVENNSTINIPKEINKSKRSIPKKGNIMCTQEAKICPDGSYVSRTGPDCEFALCPDENKAVGIANPASVFCEQNGGKLEIVTAKDGGQSGMCNFPNGLQCEEWAYMRGECKIEGIVK